MRERCVRLDSAKRLALNIALRRPLAGGAIQGLKDYGVKDGSGDRSGWIGRHVRDDGQQ
jgi:hypothetical protein